MFEEHSMSRLPSRHQLHLKPKFDMHSEMKIFCGVASCSKTLCYTISTFANILEQMDRYSSLGKL